MSFLMRGRSAWWRSDQTRPREAVQAPEAVVLVTPLPVAAPTPQGGTDDLSPSSQLNRASLQRLEERPATQATASTNTPYTLIEPIGRLAQEAAKAYDKVTEAWTEQGLIEALLAAVVPAVREQDAAVVRRQAGELRLTADTEGHGLPQTPQAKRLLNARAAELELAARRIARGDR